MGRVRLPHIYRFYLSLTVPRRAGPGASACTYSRARARYAQSVRDRRRDDWEKEVVTEGKKERSGESACTMMIPVMGQLRAVSGRKRRHRRFVLASTPRESYRPPFVDLRPVLPSSRPLLSPPITLIPAGCRTFLRTSDDVTTHWQRRRAPRRQ